MALPRKNKEPPAPQDRVEDNSALLETPGGREQDSGAGDRDTSLDESLRDDRAADFADARLEGLRHTVAPLDDETEDGLDDTEEAVRRSAEDTVEGPDEEALAEDAAVDETAAEDVLDDEKSPELPVFEEPLTEPKT